MDDRPEIVQLIAATFEDGAAKAQAGGASEVEIARALIATGLSWWGRVVPPGQIIKEMEHLLASLAIAANIDLAEDVP